MEHENKWAFGIVVLAALVVAAAVVWRDQLSDDITLPAVIAASTVAYTGFTWRSVRSAEIARNRSGINALKALLVEAQQNLRRKGQTGVWITDVPLEHAALDASASARLDLPEPLVTELFEVANRIARYNTLVHFEAAHPTGGSNSANLKKLADEVYDSLGGAIPKLRKFLDDQPGLSH